MKNKAVQVKICGLRDIENCLAAIDAGADFLGFIVNHAPSPRTQSTAEVAALTTGIRQARPQARVKTIGVLVNPDAREAIEVVKEAGLDGIQLHGQESASVCAEIRAQGIFTIKAQGIAGEADLKTLEPYLSVCDGLLFDHKAVGRAGGGFGTVFDWRLMEKVPPFSPLRMVAGGLNVQNVQGCVQATQADVLDVSSGVEYLPGKKSPDLIRAFIEAAKAH